MPYGVRGGVCSREERRLGHSVGCPCGLSAEEAAQCPTTSRSGPAICEDGGLSRNQRRPEEPAPVMLGRQLGLRRAGVVRAESCQEAGLPSPGSVEPYPRMASTRSSEDFRLCTCHLQVMLEGMACGDSACG